MGAFFVATNTSSPTLVPSFCRAVASSVKKSYQCLSSFFFSFIGSGALGSAANGFAVAVDATGAAAGAAAGAVAATGGAF